MRKGLKVERLHTTPHHQPYNNGFHSANAALIAMHLAVENKFTALSTSTVIKYMLMHDVAEGYTGDMPANVKRENVLLSNALAIAEDSWIERNNIPLPDLAHEEAVICKAADLIELGMFCRDEIAMGNRNMYFVMDNVMEYLEALMSNSFSGMAPYMKYFREPYNAI